MLTQHAKVAQDFCDFSFKIHLHLILYRMYHEDKTKLLQTKTYHKIYITQLGHTKLMLCFTEYLPSQGDPAGREKNKDKKFIMK